MEEYLVLVGNKIYWIQHKKRSFNKETEAYQYFSENAALGYHVCLQMRIDSAENFETIKTTH